MCLPHTMATHCKSEEGGNGGDQKATVDLADPASSHSPEHVMLSTRSVGASAACTPGALPPRAMNTYTTVASNVCAQHGPYSTTREGQDVFNHRRNGVQVCWLAHRPEPTQHCLPPSDPPL